MIYGRERLRWDDSTLRLDGKGRALVQIVPDGRYPDMWRVKHPAGCLSEMANRTRARDAAISHALMILNTTTAAKKRTQRRLPFARTNQTPVWAGGPHDRATRARIVPSIRCDESHQGHAKGRRRALSGRDR